MPPLTQLCQLPCQEDCQLSSWSKFSSCTADCVGVRTRKRMLVGEWHILTSNWLPDYINLESKIKVPFTEGSKPPYWQPMSSPCEAVGYLMPCLTANNHYYVFAGKSKKRDQCKNHQVYPLSETQYCPCNKYNAQPVGNWSDCILPEGGRMESQLAMKVQGDIKECGQGYRYQAMVCYDQDNRIVETSRCNSHGEFHMVK